MERLVRSENDAMVSLDETAACRRFNRLGIGLGDLFRLRRAMAAEGQEPSTSPKTTAKSCILIWLDGGPSHLETFDLKPDPPVEVRGPLAAIPTNVPGVFLSECLPRMAALLDKIAIIRSMTSPLGEHNFGTHYLMTGYQPTPRAGVSDVRFRTGSCAFATGGSSAGTSPSPISESAVVS